MTKVYEIKQIADDIRGGHTVVGTVSSIEAAKTFLEGYFSNHTVVGFDLDEAADAADAFLAPANKKVSFPIIIAVEAA